MAKGALGEGTFGLRWCPPRAARAGQFQIRNPQTRSVCSLNLQNEADAVARGAQM